MANLAIINETTNIVENLIVKPEGAQVWTCGAGYYVVETEIGGIGDTYNSETQEFIKPIIEEGE